MIAVLPCLAVTATAVLTYHPSRERGKLMVSL